MNTVKKQYITDDHGKKVAVIVPIRKYEKMLEQIEELDDIKLYDKAKKEDDGKRISLDDYIKKRKIKNA